MSERAISAQARVDEMIRAESRLSTIDKPPILENESKSSYCWRLIRKSVKQATDVMKKADIRDMVISHGIQHGRKLNHPHPILEMIYNKITKEYITLDGRMIRIFQADGRKKDIISPCEPFQKLIHAPQFNLYVGWIPDDDRIFLLNDEFELQSASKANGPIHSVVYNELISEVLTVGENFLTNWVFRYGGRHILPRRSTCDGFQPEDYFQIMALEETASRSQKLFCSTGTTVVVFNVFEGKMLTRKKELHVRTITAMLHFNPLKFLITASKDGSIKVWDEKWHLQLVFVGHGGRVTSLAVYPYGPNFMSSSEDNTIRVWSLETCDQVDEIMIDEPVNNIGTLLNHDSFFSQGLAHGDLWKVRHIHHLHTRVGHQVLNMKSTDHPHFPIRNVLLCKDSSVRIVSPVTGDVLTTLLQHPKRHLVDAAYAIAQDTLFAVFGDGGIVKCATCTNPCTILDEWPCTDPKYACNYLLVYEYVISAALSGDSWGGIQRAMGAGGLATPGSGGRSNADRTLLLGGRKDGQICVFNWDTGEVEFEIEAHGSKGVLSMIANSKADQLISSGLDNIIKIWRLYPYAQESLAPLMSFFCAHTPVYMTVLRTKLAVAFQELTSATYSIVMYNLQSKERHDHGPEDDHMDTITGVTACNKMRVLASSSSDGTVRIWNEANCLIRVIRLNSTPHSLSFCSHKGDLLVGIADHVHHIDYKQYMPKAYRFRMISMHFPPPIQEKALPFDEVLLAELSREDVKRLKAARSSFKFTHFVDILTDAENEEVMREKRQREQAFAELGARDDELAKIRDGDLPANKKPKATPMTKREAFEKYLRIFYNRTNVELPDEDPYPQDTLHKKMDGTEQPSKDIELYRPEKEPTGFFPAPWSAKPPVVPTPAPLPPSTAKIPEPLPESITRTPATPIRADGYVPNSVLVRLLWPQDVLKEEAKRKEEYRPPSLTTEQLAQIASQKKPKPKRRVLIKSTKKLMLQMTRTKINGVKGFEAAGFRDRTLVMDYDDEELQKEETETPLSKEPSAFLTQVQDLIKKTPTPPVSPVPDKTTQDAKPREEPKPKRILPARSKIPMKLTPRPAPPVRETAKDSPQQSTPRSPTPPPSSPLPDFITQFRGTEWFDKYFPNCTDSSMPKPWTAQAFAMMLARVLRIAEFSHKTDVANAIAAIHQNEGITEPEPIMAALFGVLHDPHNPPTCMDPHQKAFLLAALQLLHSLGAKNKAYYRELLVQFLDGDRDVRNVVMDLLSSGGLKDPHGYLSKELDGWDIWNLEDHNRTSEIQNMVDDWLDKWMTGFKIHVEDTIDRLKKGQNVHGRATPSQLRRPKGILKRIQQDAIAEEEDSPSGDSQRDAEESQSGVTVTFDKPPDISTLDNATYMEALNYFCEMELEKNLSRIRTGGPSRVQKSDGYKNTVLVLPKIAGKGTLVRLGETHTSKCRPKRETSLEADLRLPPITGRGRQPDPGQLYGFPPCINLPMKAVIMNPFSDDLDEYEQQEPVLLMLKTAQKYFVHQRSYLDQEV